MAQPAASSTGPFTGPVGERVATHREELRDLLHRRGVTNPRIFGSVARGDDHIGSDIDLLVDLAPGMSLFTIARLQAELEEVLGGDAAVDLVPAAGLKPAVRARIAPELIPL